MPAGRREKLHGKIVLAATSARALASRLAGGKAASFLKPIQLEGGELTFVYQSEPKPRGKPPAVRGTLEMKNLKLRHREHFRPLQNLSGKLVFDGRKISVETREAFYGDSPLHIKGGISDYGSGQPRFDLTMTSPDFMSGDFTDIPFLRTLDYRGPARVEMSLRSRGKAFQLGGKVDLSRTSYQFQKILTKPAEVSNHLEIAARIDEHDLGETESTAICAPVAKDRRGIANETRDRLRVGKRRAGIRLQ